MYLLTYRLTDSLLSSFRLLFVPLENVNDFLWTALSYPRHRYAVLLPLFGLRLPVVYDTYAYILLTNHSHGRLQPNFLLMRSIGVNVSGQIASVIAGGLILAMVAPMIGG